jgi:O-antigen/teichoic acid export membrane protein
VSTVARNIAANAAGATVGLAVLVLAVPLYLRLLGAEAYGLVGLFATLMAAAAALDLGLGFTLNREVARMTARPEEAPEFADIVATLRASSWLVGLVLGALFAALAPLLASRWLTSSTLSTSDVWSALVLMGLSIPALVARSVHFGGLSGLQRQPLANAILGGGTLLRTVLTLAVLTWVVRSVIAFFVVQVVVLHVEAILVSVTLARALPAAAGAGRIRPHAVRHLVRFTTGVGGTMLLGYAVLSLDHLVLSAILPLDKFGYYAIAAAAAATLGHVGSPIVSALYPRLSQRVERGDQRGVAEDYHFFSQLIAVLVLPLATLLVFLPEQVLFLWTRDPEVVRHGALVLSLRTCGTVLQTFMYVPHILQLAAGWSTFAALVNAAVLVVMAPLTVALALAWGAPGAALAWVVLSLGVVLLAMPRMHRRLLPGELGGWYARMLLPTLAAAVIGAVARAGMPETPAAPARLAWMALTFATASVAVLAAAPTVRRRLASARRAVRAS